MGVWLVLGHGPGRRVAAVLDGIGIRSTRNSARSPRRPASARGKGCRAAHGRHRADLRANLADMKDCYRAPIAPRRGQSGVCFPINVAAIGRRHDGLLRDGDAHPVGRAAWTRCATSAGWSPRPSSGARRGAAERKLQAVLRQQGGRDPGGGRGGRQAGPHPGGDGPGRRRHRPAGRGTPSGSRRPARQHRRDIGPDRPDPSPRPPAS